MAKHNLLEIQLLSEEYIKEASQRLAQRLAQEKQIKVEVEKLTQKEQVASCIKWKEEFIKQLQAVDFTKHCEKCGALGSFDIAFCINDKTKYYFTLWKVEENECILAETDYEKLCDWFKKLRRKNVSLKNK